MKTYVDGNGLSEEIGEMFKIRKIRNNVIRKFAVRLHKIQTVELVWPRAKNGRRKATSENFGTVLA